MTGGLAADAARVTAILVVGAIAGLGSNAWRSDGVELGRTYFLEDADRAELLEDGFALVDTARAQALFQEARDYPGFVVFLDARDDELFSAGRVRGALQLDFYRLHEQLDAVRPALEAADTVVVYCGSIECDDALLLCRALRDSYSFPAEKLKLYRDGFAAWQAAGSPVSEGVR